ncbi:M18 family aminopeptidase [Olsenella profusa]|uniref:M18 family aminopeptidase n=1 Tax=Olsenella profusa TaxID=138595 RepID=A0ABS2F3L8_9ACTN|nr:M18 family aminopeptidase [Olsenella profusa]MBM6775143.1 M18 family aminopeptidase [Olsenella profusa]
MPTNEKEAAAGLVEFLRACPTAFHAVAEVRARLDAAGFTYLPEQAPWDVVPGGRYYTVRNNSSVVAWKVGADACADGAYHFQMTASHADSPTYKVKAVPELVGEGGSLRLDVEAYGGMIDHTWLDRPLGVAGRVLVRAGSRVESRLVDIRQDVCLIPSVAIHLERGSGLAPQLNRAVDLCPLFSAGELATGAFDEMVAEAAGCAPADVLARDLLLVAHEEPRVWGRAGEFVSGARLDDLQCAYAALSAFLATENPRCVTVYACFDNEEVGSGTKQGALSTLLADALARTSAALGKTDEEHRRAIAASMLVSCDNAHAVHPSHPEKMDGANRCHLNGGLVVKEAANQHYCTDAFSRAVLVAVLERAGVPYQTFANRSDVAGGSTLGNLSNVQVSVHAVDVGCPQLAMHSVFETAGARDTALAIDALEAFYDADLLIDGSDAVELA